MTDLTWMREAACRALPLATSEALFFSDRWADRLEGIRLCATCPVRVRCLELANTHETSVQKNYRAGTYGGLTVAQRIERARS